MSRADIHRLDDIRAAAELILELAGRGRAAFDSDPAVRLAMERLLEIIGEASTALSEQTMARYPAVPWVDVRRMRIVLAHHYHRIDQDQIWTIATGSIPQLLGDLRTAEGG
ncbi:MAG TPA: HepT-like ribonuclease domain-containing protein [Nakamurella sp.]